MSTMMSSGEESAHASSEAASGKNSHSDANKAETAQPTPAADTAGWADRQRAAVQRVKYLVVLLLGFATVTCGYYTFVLSKKEEYSQFERSVRSKCIQETLCCCFVWITY